jgi:hypothetical protein
LAHLFGDPGEQRRLRCLVVAVVIFRVRVVFRYLREDLVLFG